MPLHSPLPPFAATSGSNTPRIVLVGEAWGEGEVACRQPFVGESGKELWRMLGEAMPAVAPEAHGEVMARFRHGLEHPMHWRHARGAWLEAAGIAMTNVLALRPPGNALEGLCGTKAEVGGAEYTLPTITKGKYLRGEYLAELERLRAELASWKPNLVVALGNTACWAMLQATNIGSIRGNVTWGVFDQVKVLPTYHPAVVLRQWAWRPVVVADLMKAARESEFPEIRRPDREILINPTIEEVQRWTVETLHEGPRPKMLAVDIETGAGMIKCIGFARSRSEALVVPFIDRGKPGWSYWDNAYDESRAWACVEDLLESTIMKLFQNGLYDLQYICRHGIRPKALAHDTMLLHHSLFPELQKGLGFLGSIYTNEASWKLMRRQRADTEKRDE